MGKRKCVYCGKFLNMEKEEWTQVSPCRIAHKACFDKENEHRLVTDDSRGALYDYIDKILKDKVDIDWPLVTKQIETCIKKKNWTYSGIKRTLIYCYEIKKFDPYKSGGNISVVFTNYPLAYKYYEKIFLRDKNNLNKKINTKEKIIEIKPQTARKKIQLFDMGED